MQWKLNYFFFLSSQCCVNQLPFASNGCCVMAWEASDRDIYPTWKREQLNFHYLNHNKWRNMVNHIFYTILILMMPALIWKYSRVLLPSFSLDQYANVALMGVHLVIFLVHIRSIFIWYIFSFRTAYSLLDYAGWKTKDPMWKLVWLSKSPQKIGTWF